jgi:DNA replication protein DnaC
VPAVSKAHVMALVEADNWIAQGHNLLAFGPPGTGKTHLLAAIGHALIDRGLKVLFMRTSELVQRLQAARRDQLRPLLDIANTPRASAQRQAFTTELATFMRSRGLVRVLSLCRG